MLLDDVNFINRGWINRNRILLQGEPHTVTLPLSRASQNRKICEIEIHGDQHGKLLKTLACAYAKSPGKDIILALAERVVSFRGLLADALHGSIEEVCRLLQIRTEILRSSTLETWQGLAGQARLIAITRKLGGSTYVNPPGGRHLYSRSAFAQADLDLKFIEPVFIPYPQKSSAFIPGLSILDMLASAPYSESVLGDCLLVD